jgi:hypothetical protein
MGQVYPHAGCVRGSSAFAHFTDFRRATLPKPAIFHDSHRANLTLEPHTDSSVRIEDTSVRVKDIDTPYGSLPK